MLDKNKIGDSGCKWLSQTQWGSLIKLWLGNKLLTQRKITSQNQDASGSVKPIGRKLLKLNWVCFK